MTQQTAAATSDAVLDREETISRDELEALQLGRLQHTVAYAYDRVPLYKRKFDEAGVHPTDLRELDDLAKFPFTTKEDLRLEYPFGMFAVPQHEVAGSTPAPAPRAAPPWSGTPSRTSPTGPSWWHAHSGPPGSAPA